MPKKSRRKRKQSFQDKGKASPLSSVTGTQEKVAQPTTRTTPPEHIAPANSLISPSSRPNPNPQIVAELKRIGMLAGIIVGTLVVLAFTLP